MANQALKKIHRVGQSSGSNGIVVIVDAVDLVARAKHLMTVKPPSQMKRPVIINPLNGYFK